MKKTVRILTTILLACSFQAFAQIVNTVTFKADITELLSQGFTPGVNTIRVEGLNWDNSAIAVSGDRMMNPDPNNNKTYLTILTITSGTTGKVGDTARWKFKGGPDAQFVNSGWESGDPLTGYDGRVFAFKANGSTSELEVMTPRLQKIVVSNLLKNTVTFKADLSDILGTGKGYFDPVRGDKIEVRGFWGNASDTNIIDGSLVSGDPFMTADPFNPSIYSTTLVLGLPQGSKPGKGTGFKFKASPDSNFSNSGWEPTPNRNYIFGAENAFVEMTPIKTTIAPARGLLTAPLTALFQVKLVEGSRNRYDKSLIPRDQVKFAFIKGASNAFFNWAGSWTLADTSRCFILNDNGLNGDKVAKDNIWSAKVTFKTDQLQGPSPYKYGVYYPGCETIPGAGTGYLDNSAGSGADLVFDIKQNTAVVEVLDTWPTVSLTGVSQIAVIIPSAYMLNQNYPNPFNPETQIQYTLKESGKTRLDVFNLLGAHVAGLVDGYQEAGTYTVRFAPENLPSGIYFYTITSNNFRATEKMIYLR